MLTDILDRADTVRRQAPAEGLVAVVTGAAQGIGEATARLLALTYRIAVLDIQDRGADTAAAIVRAGGEADFFRCDLTNLDNVRSTALAIADKWAEPIDVLVNNAGWTPNETFLEQNSETWHEITAINFLAVLYTCHTFLPRMRDEGAIVNVASDAARIGVPNEAVYSGAKAAVIGFSKALAVELSARRIRVNVVSPGTTLTPLVKAMLSDEQIARRIRSIPLGRLAEASEVAEAIVALAVGQRYITGQVLSVNGGSSRFG